MNHCYIEFLGTGRAEPIIVQLFLVAREYSFYNFETFSWIQDVPKSHEGESKEEAKNTAKFSHQGRKWIYQLLTVDHGQLRHSPQGEGELSRLARRVLLLPNELVLLV